MGLLIVDSTCIGGKKLEIDTVSCKHCQAVIKVILKGVKKARQTKYNCTRCHGPICRHCAEVRGGVCAPILAQVEDALKTGIWNPLFRYQYKILPN